MRLLLGVMLTSMVCCSLQAQSPSTAYAIVGAKVHTMGPQGSLQSATVLIKDGKIQQVLEQDGAVSGYEVIDGKGKVLTPGLMGAYTNLGLVEVDMSAGTVDASTKMSEISKVGAGLDVSYGINPDSSLIAISRIEGITSAATTLANTHQLFQGQGAIISLGDKRTPLLKTAAFVSLDMSNDGVDENGESRAVTWVALGRTLREASTSSTLSLFTLHFSLHCPVSGLREAGVY